MSLSFDVGRRAAVKTNMCSNSRVFDRYSDIRCQTSC